jgi:hypothetical protein
MAIQFPYVPAVFYNRQGGDSYASLPLGPCFTPRTRLYIVGDIALNAKTLHVASSFDATRYM